MKSKKDWWFFLMDKNGASITLEEIGQIQLDAMKEGARRASNVGVPCEYVGNSVEYSKGWIQGVNAAKKAILTAAEHWTENDL